MLSPETLEAYRRMTPGQRLGLTLQLTREAQRGLVEGSREVVKRREELLSRQNDERNARMIAGMRGGSGSLQANENT